MHDVLVRRFDYYFRHPDWTHDVLQPGDRAIACRNIRRALSWMDIGSADTVSEGERDLYDSGLQSVVRSFQTKYRHCVADGLVGPGTRRLLVAEILHRTGPDVFARLTKPERRQLPSAFLSYAWADSDKVDKVDQWLRDHGVEVIRDQGYFMAGVSIQENIARALAAADKIVAVYSRNSRGRDWPHLERTLAEEIEARLGGSLLVYLCIDDSPLPAHDSTRIAISAEGMTLKQVGERLLHTITGRPLPAVQHPYDENEVL